MKNVQISKELFLALLHYHLDGEDEYADEIVQGLEQKLEAMLRRDLYAKYKTALTGEEREIARLYYFLQSIVNQEKVLLCQNKSNFFFFSFFQMETFKMFQLFHRLNN